MDRNELPLDPHHLGVQSGAPKMISKPIACSAQVRHLFALRLTLSLKWFLSLWYIQRKPCTNLMSRLTPSLNWAKWASTWPTWTRSTVMCDQYNFHGRSAQTVPSTKINVISIRTETSFNLTHVTQEFHRGHPKWFLCPWYIRCKPCTDLTPTLTLSPNGPNQAYMWHTSPRSSIGCPKRFPCTWNIRRKPCTYLALRLTLSPNGPKCASTWPMSHRSTIGHVQNDF
jgi:hypothetical protein